MLKGEEPMEVFATRPDLGAIFQDFLLMRSCPGAIDYAAQPPHWKRKIRLLSTTWECTLLHLAAKEPPNPFAG